MDIFPWNIHITHITHIIHISFSNSWNPKAIRCQFCLVCPKNAIQQNAHFQSSVVIPNAFQTFQDLTKDHMLPVEPIGGRHGDEEPAMAAVGLGTSPWNMPWNHGYYGDLWGFYGDLWGFDGNIPWIFGKNPWILWMLWIFGRNPWRLWKYPMKPSSHDSWWDDLMDDLMIPIDI